MIKMKTKLKGMLLTAMLATASVSANAQMNVNVNAGIYGDSISPTLYGIFFEEINHAGDGGLYAELVANRSFESNTVKKKYLDYWNKYADASIFAVSAEDHETAMLNSVQLHAAKVVADAAGGGIINNGYKGIHVVSGRTYKLNFFAKGAEAGAVLTAKLVAADTVTVLGSVQIDPLTTDWKKYSVTITATGDADRGKLAITSSAAGTFYLDVVSLFPPTYKDHENGLRPDLAQAMEDLHPGFVRFPGGCYVEGLKNADCGDLDCHYEWKNSLGPIEERAGHYNNNWGYEITDGMGVMEYLQFCEDLKAEPLYVTNIGIGHEWVHDYKDIGSYIQDAMDFIEFCNGDATTTWGKKRIELGHEKPFNLRLLEVGNENNPMGNDVTDGYYLRYKQFHDAIAAKYPSIDFIGNGMWSGEGWDATYPVDYVDEHYYSTPEFFINRYNLYDNSSRTSHKRYIGEYAVTQDFGKVGDVYAALGEAVYMCGLEKNSEAVAMASYAPIYQNDDMPGWWPSEMVHFNNHDMFVTPSYYMQQLFPKYLGKRNVNVAETDNSEVNDYYVGVGSYLSNATYSDLKVTYADGTTMVPNYKAANWIQSDTNSKTWTYNTTSIAQTDDSKIDQRNVFQTKLTSTSYTYEMKATRTSGAEGFVIPFNYADAGSYCWLNIGGWGNTKTSFEQCIGSRSSIGASSPFSVKNGQTYAIRIVVDGNTVKGFVDDKQVASATIAPSVRQKVYTCATINEAQDKVYLRIINPYKEAQQVTINMKNADINDVSGEIMTGNKLDENSWATPENVKPQTLSGYTINGNAITYTVPAYSANFINMGVSNVTEQKPDPVVIPTSILTYNFEEGTPDDSTKTYTGTLHGKAEIKTMPNGNKVLYTGATGGEGYMDLGATVGQTVGAQLTGDYAFSVDMKLDDASMLTSYCWPFAFCKDASEYIALINAGNDRGMYVEAKSTNAQESVASGVKFTAAPTDWHNVCFSQSGTTATIYIDGEACGSATMSVNPSTFAADLTNNYFGKSPYPDPIFTGLYIDNFRMFASSLSAAQVKLLNSMKTTDNVASGINGVQNNAQKEQGSALIYDLNGRTLQSGQHGLYITNGKKVVM